MGPPPARRMKSFTPQVLSVAALLALGAATAAQAEVYWFTDENGVAHFSNVPADARYVPFLGDHDGPAARKRYTSIAPHLKARYAGMIDSVARIYALESELIHAVISVESAYDANAISKKGAAGLMQLMPATARRYGVIDRFDPVQNLHGGAKYLSDLLRMFNGDMSLSLAAYNAGERNVIRHGNRIPPFPETRNYVPRVLEFYRKYQAGGKLGT